MSVVMPMHAFTKPRYGDRRYSSLESILDNPTQLLMSSQAVERPIGGDLDILSASQYPQGLMQPYEEMEAQNPRKRKATSSMDQLYGGIVLAGSAASESNRSSSAEHDTPSTQKKAKSTKRASTNEGDEQAMEKKQRGRPRLDTHDETAADRRRTQIRLAQRAYRHRKETTISALKQKVTDLQNTIEQMNKTFLTLHDNMVDAGILASHYALGRQLQSATEAFVALSKIASPESDDEEEAAIAALTQGEGKASPEAGEKSNNRRGSGSKDAKLSSSTTKPSAKKTNVRRGVSFNDHGSPDAEADVEDLPAASQSVGTFLAPSQTAWTLDNSNIHGLNEVLSFDANTTIPDAILYDDLKEKLVVERPLNPPNQPQGSSYTYSFQETTFARRLHRMCLERAFRNLTSPSIDPAYIKRVFRFTFCFSNRRRMLQRFQEVLKRRAGESLENWNVPFFHIGGAGTHFPRRDDDGNPIYPPNMVSPARAFGPQPYVEAETPRLEASMQEMLDNIGFGGIWFDSHDVEEYLKTKGLYLTGQSSFVEVDPAVLSLVKSTNSSTTTNSDGDASTSDHSPLENALRTPSPLLPVEHFTDPFIAPDLSELWGPLLQPAATVTTTAPATARVFTPAASSAQTPKSTNGDDDDSNIWASFPFPFSSGPGTSTPPGFSDDLLGSMRRRRQPTRPLLTFDVEMFLERMIEGSACLGRAPGFRKAAIDQALVASLQEGF
ncbi:hypothetical protein G647_08755 [Cladophialophora carrionii CBS 160.54]|uniref:BZIP domain-containing protein n=1 Tax=Cladophialophora carrionii CBS 160.54 TaxID=1279043 RepID=V9D178_9EURO|nr:uncharacterized protein G647_08755 [Cladophialophora carrionii CBS 160.54]ETI19742.1 hypothetical protein G647_08755 [Cladophialophora carrionii CBS 160.54]